eukprot:Hpha_TRINITY_DN16695_c7_g7::TRINITY_DN16695_c7_g7_i1::g.182562::m.182562
MTTAFGFQDPTLAAAEAFPDTNWVHISGYKSGPQNFAVAWCRVYQARWLSGMVAASQSQSGKIGYVGAFPFVSEVVRGMNAYALGARRIKPDSKVYVPFLMTWEDTARAEIAAEWLLELGCDVVTGHVNSAVVVFNKFIERGFEAIGYYTDMTELYGDSVVVSAYFEWGNMYTRFAEETLNGVQMLPKNFDGMETGVPVISPMSHRVSKATRDTVTVMEDALKNGADYSPQGGSALIFCGPMKDEYGDVVLHNSSDCADLNTYPRGGGVLDMAWFVEGVEDLGAIPLPHEVCGAGFRYTWKPLGKRVMDNERHKDGALGAGREKIRFDFTCEPCPAGSYSPSAGSTLCTLCPPGAESPLNATSCNECPTGTYAPENGTVQCIACPDGVRNTGTGNSVCDVALASSWISDNWWVVLVAGAGLLLLLVPPVVWAFSQQQRRLRRLFNNNAIAESCAESIAAMRLEEVHYIKEIKHPNKIQLAFIGIIDNLIEYRRYLPASVLGDDEEDDVNKDGVTESHMTKSKPPSSIGSPVAGPSPAQRGHAASPGAFAHRVRTALYSACDGKFQLSLREKRVGIAIINLVHPVDGDGEGDPAVMYNALLSCIEHRLKTNKGFLQVTGTMSLVCTWNTIFSSIQPAVPTARCLLQTVEAWRSDPQNAGLLVYAGLEVVCGLCGNIGTEKQRHYVTTAANGKSVGQTAHLLCAYAERFSPSASCVLQEDKCAQENETDIVARQIDSVTFERSAQKKSWVTGGIHQVMSVRDSGGNEEWMYMLEQQEGKMTMANAFNKAWHAITAGGSSEKLPSLLERVEVAALAEDFNLSSDPAWALLSEIAKQGGQHPRVCHISAFSLTRMTAEER